MPFQDHLRHSCKVCDRPREEGERFSARGKCTLCAETRMLDEHRELRAFRGPHYEHWRRRMLETLLVLPVDKPAERE